MSDLIHTISDASFEADVIQSTVPVIVDFWAVWCGPCKALGPVFEDVAKAYPGKVKFTKLDVDSNPLIPTKFGIQSIPTLILFKDGQIKARHAGLLNKAGLTSFIDSNI